MYMMDPLYPRVGADTLAPTTKTDKQPKIPHVQLKLTRRIGSTNVTQTGAGELNALPRGLVTHCGFRV